MTLEKSKSEKSDVDNNDEIPSNIHLISLITLFSLSINSTFIISSFLSSKISV